LEVTLEKNNGFLKTALRAVLLINELIRMNSVQKILRSCFSSLVDSEMKLLV